MKATPMYTCPMHPEVKADAASKCPRCGMSLVPQGAKHPFLRHMLGSPLHVAIMAAAMLIVMAAAMMLMR
jgi:uncharacterized paraquat-inducible protein A